MPRGAQKSAAAKINDLQKQLGIEPGQGFCSRWLGQEEVQRLFNSREIAKLDIECAKLLET